MTGHVGIHPHSRVPLLDDLLALLRVVPAGDPEREAVALALAAPGRPDGENDLPNSSQYGGSSHPRRRMRAVSGALTWTYTVGDTGIEPVTSSV